MNERESQLAQSLKALWVEYLGHDLSRWPERQQEFRCVSARAQRSQLWTVGDWACTRCSTMNLEFDGACRKCGMTKDPSKYKPITLKETVQMSDYELGRHDERERTMLLIGGVRMDAQTGATGDVLDKLVTCIAAEPLPDVRGAQPDGSLSDAMPRRWCSVHEREEFKYEALEHEMKFEKVRAFDAALRADNKDNPSTKEALD